MVRHKLIDCRGNKTRQDVSEALEITPQMLGAIERGDRTPSLKLAKRIADYYKLSVDEIFFNQNGHDSFLDKEKII
ncbi:Helix-turn-helix [Oceanobacillus oncorhynchi]|uniref:Helix-turn-helix n=1 Tax=Oceanobacillus oncorhynchi TaxID=545501 RepID=A0A0A1MDW1_9BACI|nr:helix-turn-helix transcriptional regulator [Oceanobacillus oncorhynchi]CEI81253.1 Helix-turn-helix [Oceanobacillus oncorhynchi]